MTVNKSCQVSGCLDGEVVTHSSFAATVIVNLEHLHDLLHRRFVLLLVPLVAHLDYDIRGNCVWCLERSFDVVVCFKLGEG